jgi:hypothetical protein
MSLSPVPSEQPDTTCANCGSPLVADQRYCLSCGQPVTPVRLAFLDALTPAGPPAPPPGSMPTTWAQPGTIEVSPAGYIPVQSQQGASAWLRRNSGLMGLLTVLVLCLLAGLLIGHWVSQSKAPANQIVKIEGLGGLGAVATSATTTPTTTSATPSTATKSSSSQEAKEAAEGEHETKAEKAPPKAPKKVAPTQLKKLTESKGKKHQEEINALGPEPIETG